MPITHGHLLLGRHEQFVHRHQPGPRYAALQEHGAEAGPLRHLRGEELFLGHGWGRKHFLEIWGGNKECHVCPLMKRNVFMSVRLGVCVLH